MHIVNVIPGVIGEQLQFVTFHNRVIEQQTEETLTEKHRMQSRMDELEYKIKKRDECNENLRQQHKK